MLHPELSTPRIHFKVFVASKRFIVIYFTELGLINHVQSINSAKMEVTELTLITDSYCTILQISKELEKNRKFTERNSRHF
jgi:hypothetical protein